MGEVTIFKKKFDLGKLLISGSMVSILVISLGMAIQLSFFPPTPQSKFGPGAADAHPDKAIVSGAKKAVPMHGGIPMYNQLFGNSKEQKPAQPFAGNGQMSPLHSQPLVVHTSPSHSLAPAQAVVPQYPNSYQSYAQYPGFQNNASMAPTSVLTWSGQRLKMITTR